MLRFSLGSLILTYLMACPHFDLRAADPPPDSQAAKMTREKKLKAKISVDSTSGGGMMIREIIEEIKGEIKSAKAGVIRIKPDPNAGITLTSRSKFEAKNEPLEDVLVKMFKGADKPWGYYVFVSKKKDDQDDGAIIITNDPTCRGYPPGDPRNKKLDGTSEEPKKSK